MVQPGCYRGLAPQPLHRCGISGKPGDQNLYRNRLSSGHVLCLIDIGHPTFTQLSIYLIALVENLTSKAGQRGGKGIGWMRGIFLAPVADPGIASWRLRTSLHQERAVFDTEARRCVVRRLAPRAAAVAQSRNRFLPSLFAR